jgi:hypothetical protein
VGIRSASSWGQRDLTATQCPATISTKLAFSLVGKSHLRLGIFANLDVRRLGLTRSYRSSTQTAIQVGQKTSPQLKADLRLRTHSACGKSHDVLKPPSLPQKGISMRFSSLFSILYLFLSSEPLRRNKLCD